MCDCAAENNKTSLYKALMQGPDYSLVLIPLRFRKDSTMLVADKVSPSEQNSLRFLWWPGGDLITEPFLYRMKVHLFGPTSSPCCAGFVLRHSVVDFEPQVEPFVSDIIERCFYVDDLQCSVPSLDIGVNIMNCLHSLLSKVGFTLTKWLSNCQAVTESLLPKERSKALKLEAQGEEVMGRVLGRTWTVATDAFIFATTIPWKPRTKCKYQRQ